MISKKLYHLLFLSEADSPEAKVFPVSKWILLFHKKGSHWRNHFFNVVRHLATSAISDKNKHFSWA